MALDKTQWTDAISQLIEEGHFGEITLWHNGNQADDFDELDIWDDATNTDVKPTEAELEAAYNRFQPLEQSRQEMNQAKSVGLEQAKEYLRKQLASQAPDIAEIFNTIKAHVDGNAVLARMLNNQIGLLRGCFGWPALDLATPVGRQRYIFAVQQVIALLT